VEVEKLSAAAVKKLKAAEAAAIKKMAKNIKLEPELMMAVPSKKKLKKKALKRRRDDSSSDDENDASSVGGAGGDDQYVGAYDDAFVGGCELLLFF
jgi:hypothetical protein